MKYHAKYLESFNLKDKSQTEVEAYYWGSRYFPTSIIQKIDDDTNVFEFRVLKNVVLKKNKEREVIKDY